jgi:beta-xylosidase
MPSALEGLDSPIRDPFIVHDEANSRFVLFGTTEPFRSDDGPAGFDYWTSPDLGAWEGPHAALRTDPEEGWRNAWAPEVYRRDGMYVMLATLTTAEGARGVYTLESPAVTGPYSLRSATPVTPAHVRCLDGTLYLDQEDKPWLIFCKEWLDSQDGEMLAAPLNAALTELVARPMLLFTASSAPWVIPVDEPDHKTVHPSYVTDGPFVHRTITGELLLLWSSYGAGGYTTGVARSLTRAIAGPWVHNPTPLWSRDGGHPMLVDGPNGLNMAIHAPNIRGQERVRLLPVRDLGSTIALRGMPGLVQKQCAAMTWP